MFVADPEERVAARKEYADFVAAEAKDIERVKARHADRAAASKLYEQIAKRAGKYSNRAPDLIDAAGKANNYELATEIAGKVLDIGITLPAVDRIVDGYHRLIHEYDETIKIAEASNEIHKTTLSGLDAVLPPKDYRPPPVNNAPPQSAPKSKESNGASATSPRPTLYAERMDSVINELTGPSAWRVAQYGRSLEATLRRASPSKTSAQTYPIFSTAPSPAPGWSYSMTPLGRKD